jgi:hypothetical protein
MSSLNIKVYDSTGKMVQGIEAVIRGVGNWAPFWDTKSGIVSKAWAKSRRVMFQTQGQSTTANWPDYTPQERKYYLPVKRWVLGVKRLNTKGGILRYTATPSNSTPEPKEKLYPSLVDINNKHYVYKVVGDSAIMGTSLPYAANHNSGTGSWTRRWGRKKSIAVPTPKRPLVRLSKEFSEDVRQALISTAVVTGGKLGLTSAEAVRRYNLNPNGFLP